MCLTWSCTSHVPNAPPRNKPGKTSHVTDVTDCGQFQSHRHNIMNMQTCLLAITTTLKLPASQRAKPAVKIPLLGWETLYTQLHSELQGVCSHAHKVKSCIPPRIDLSTCDITPVITYTRPSSHLLYFWVRGEEPGDKVMLEQDAMLRNNKVLLPQNGRVLLHSDGGYNCI